MDQMQAMLDGMSAGWQKERASSQMTLGDFIKVLSGLDNDALIDGIEDPHSYRGYYSDLAFERAKGKTPAVIALDMCNTCMGKVFEGYKGGDFVMGELTPIWMADYGMTGERIMSINEDGNFLTKEEDS